MAIKRYFLSIIIVFFASCLHVCARTGYVNPIELKNSSVWNQNQKLGFSQLNTTDSLRKLKLPWGEISLYGLVGFSSGLGEPIIPLLNDPAGFFGSTYYNNATTTVAPSYGFGATFTVLRANRFVIRLGIGYQSLKYMAKSDKTVYKYSTIPGSLATLVDECSQCYEFSYITKMYQIPLVFDYIFMRAERQEYYSFITVSGGLIEKEGHTGVAGMKRGQGDKTLSAGTGLGSSIALSKRLDLFTELFVNFEVLGEHSFYYYFIGLRCGISIHHKYPRFNSVETS